MTILAGVAILIVLLLLGVPIGFALGIGGAISFLLVGNSTALAGLMQGVVHHTTANFVLLTIPMFVLMSEFLGVGGIAQDLMIACERLLRGVRGGLAVACVLAGAVLAAASGSSTASVATMVRSAFPTMKALGYHQGFAIGTISIAGTLAIMIPPSIAMVVYGIITEESIGRLFMAGFIPGILTAIGYIMTIWYCVWRNPKLVPSDEQIRQFTDNQGSQADRGRIWPVGILILVVIGCLYSGVATPTEVAAIGALGALIISVLMRRMTWHGMIEAIGNTARTTAMIITIIIGAVIFGYFMAFTQSTNLILEWISHSGMPPLAVLIMIMIIYILLGMIMDQFAIIVLTVPITYAVVKGLGYDGIWYGILIVKTAEIGLVTPPVGLNIFIASAASGVQPGEGFRGVAPFVVTEIIILAILVAFPEISLFLPNLLG
ncbi:MAG TPA: TRAP transporter large permease subunit [Pseudolabrys sp.]|nr:TRAP transporter large permease subunit [Pseudolabrys sp.]